MLSGHTDVVPVAGQDWTSDPWTLTERDGKLYGRGTCDMKGFDAIALALVPEMVAAPLKRPVHIALSYDEEVGCLGAPHHGRGDGGGGAEALGRDRRRALDDAGRHRPQGRHPHAHDRARPCRAFEPRRCRRAGGDDRRHS